MTDQKQTFPQITSATANPDLAKILSYYAQDREHDRLTRGLGTVEFARTLELLDRLLLPAPAVVVDVGGGTGVYARELLSRGYTVHFLDAVPGHIARVQHDPTLNTLASINLGDARALPYETEMADAVLLFGPLYHLTEHVDRLQALKEAYRILKPGRCLLGTVIPRSAFIQGEFTKGLTDESYARPLREQSYHTGIFSNPDNRPEYFTTAYFHHIHEVLKEFLSVGFLNAQLFAVEGLSNLLPDPASVMADPLKREGLLASLRLLEQDVNLLGVSAHILAVAER